MVTSGMHKTLQLSVDNYDILHLVRQANDCMYKVHSEECISPSCQIERSYLLCYTIGIRLTVIYFICIGAVAVGRAHFGQGGQT